MAITKASPEMTYGRRLLPQIIDNAAATEPGREVFQLPRSTNPDDGWKSVTIKDLSNAVNNVAQILLDTLGKPQTPFPTIAYVGPNDARYIIIMIAAMKAGYKAFFPSPRNALEGQMNLLKELDCNIVAVPPSHRAQVQPWLERREMKVLEVDSQDSWFADRGVAHVPYSKTFEEAEWDPAVVLHTSGSTGFPKPIVVRVGLLATGDALRKLPNSQGASFFFYSWAQRCKRHFVPMPLFHGAGVYICIHLILHYGTSVALGVDRPMSPQLMAHCLQKVDVDSVLLPPAILENMSHNENHIEILKKLKIVAFGGGNLAVETGNRLVKEGVMLVNGIGSTEMTPMPTYFQPNPHLWQYFHFNSDVLGADWRPVDEGDLRELVVVRKGDKPGIQGCFYTFPDANEFSTKDLFSPHPSLPDFWKFCGRADNIIVFSNGEKLNPVTIEETIMGHPEVKGAIVTGVGRFQAGLIIEPASEDSRGPEFIDRVWGLIEQVNELTVAHGRVARDMIMLSSPDKPFPRSGKGAIQRAASLKLYKDEIDNLYENAAQMEPAEVPELDLASEEALASSIVDMFQSMFGIAGLTVDADFFSLGIDSLQVINATKSLRQALGSADHVVDQDQLAPAQVYENPTARLLASYILQNIVDATATGDASKQTQPEEAMKRIYENLTQDLPPAIPGRQEPNDVNQTVVLTGSTGMLGSYMLDLMVRNSRVKTVICLNRPDDGGAKKQLDAMKYRGLSTSYEKAEFYHVDISLPDFGLAPSLLSRLLRETDRWIHNAWPVNFNFSVESFEPHIRGVRNVADFAAKAEKRVAVAFISSIGTTDQWSLDTPIPETRLDDLSLPSAGYGRSKLVGSLVLEEVAKAGDFPAAIIRVGQVAGPLAEAGAWNRHEWLPSIIASSLYLKALPADLGLMSRVDWTPAECVAGLVLDVAGVSQQVRPEDIGGYYHAVNPEPTTWQALAPAVQQFYGTSRLPELITFAEWIERLGRSQLEPTNPGLKLIHTYRGMSMAGQAGRQSFVFDTHHTLARSPTLRNTHAVTPELMQQWCKQWRY